MVDMSIIVSNRAVGTELRPLTMSGHTFPPQVSQKQLIQHFGRIWFSNVPSLRPYYLPLASS